MILEPDGTGLKLGGNGVVNVTKGAIQVNSSDPTSAIVNQSNATIMAEEVAVKGGISGAGAIVTSPTPDNVTHDVAPAPDPLAPLPAPTEPPPGSIAEVSAKTQAEWDRSRYWERSRASRYVTGKIMSDPGTFSSNPNPLSNYTAFIRCFNQASAGGGIYYLRTAASPRRASMVMSPATTGGMMFYNEGRHERQRSGAGNGRRRELGPLTSGPHQGMMIFRIASPPSRSRRGNGLICSTFTPQGNESDCTARQPSARPSSRGRSRSAATPITLNFGSGLVAQHGAAGRKKLSCGAKDIPVWPARL